MRTRKIIFKSAVLIFSVFMTKPLAAQQVPAIGNLIIQPDGKVSFSINGLTVDGFSSPGMPSISYNKLKNQISLSCKLLPITP